jgi:hypothetical protein
MNKRYIADELKKRNIPVTFFWHEDAGPALRFFYHDPEKGDMHWNALLPMDDESDAEFVDFVEVNYQRLLARR